MKEFADNNLNVAIILEFALDGAENIVGGENAFSPLPQSIRKRFYLRVIKSWDRVIKG